MAMDSATTASLKGFTRNKMSLTTHKLVPPDVSKLEHVPARMVLLVDSTNRGIIWRLRKLRQAIGYALTEVPFELLCDYMGYYLYDAFGFTRILACDQFSIDLSGICRLSLTVTPYLSYITNARMIRIVNTTWIPYRLDICVEDLWKWLLARNPFTDVRSIRSPFMEWNFHEEFNLDFHGELSLKFHEMFAIDSTIPPATKDAGYDAFECAICRPEIVTTIKEFLRTEFRRAAGWPTFAL